VTGQAIAELLRGGRSWAVGERDAETLQLS